MKKSLESLKNFGPYMVRQFAEIDVYSADEFLELGAVEAYVRLCQHQGKRAHKMILIAMIGATQGVGYQSLERDEIDFVVSLVDERLADIGL